MIKHLFVASLLFFLVAPTALHATELTYAAAVVTSSSNVLSASYALGAPDNLFADFRAADASITLDMDAELLTDLTLTYRIFDTGAAARVELYDADMIKLQTTASILSISDDTLTVPCATTTPYHFVKIIAAEPETWSVDAVSAEAETAESTDDNTAEPPTAEQTTGMLIKTETNAAVYVLGSDDKRHAFPNEAIFYTWFASFDDVVTVDATTLASYKLGASVTVRPGTSLVKLTTDPKTYAVEPGGVLRWITSESAAINLYGVNWANRVLDLPDTMWPNYTLGTDAGTAVHPDGTVLADRRIDGTTYWYIVNALRLEISSTDFVSLQFGNTFVIDDLNDALGLYVDGGDFTLSNDVQYPY